MSVLQEWALVAYMVGVVVKRFISAQVGEAIEVVSAILIVLVWLVSWVR